MPIRSLDHNWVGRKLGRLRPVSYLLGHDSKLYPKNL